MFSITIYPIVAMILWAAFIVFSVLLLLRMVFSYADFNPFGTLGRLGFKIRKATERVVYPAARFLANFRIDTRLAPLVTFFIAFVLTYFVFGIVRDTFFVIDNLRTAVTAGSLRVLIGFALYGLLGLLALFIFIRFISMWFVFTRNTFLGFVRRVTDPVMLPFQRLIPTIGMFDISAMIVLFLIGLLQSAVLSIFAG